MQYSRFPKTITTALVCVLLLAQTWSCGRRESVPRDTNLVVNGSFEEIVDSLPAGWTITNFRGLPDGKPSVFAVDTTDVHQGSASFRFAADEDAKRFVMLSQEVRVGGADRIRVRAAVKYANLRIRDGQYPQSNVAVTYYDRERARFSSARFADDRMKPHEGTSDGWRVEERLFKLPPETEYVTVHCVLGMSGTIWFDDVSMEIPVGLPWEVEEGPVFVHHWVRGSGYPEGSIEYQQAIYDAYARQLGIREEDRHKIQYYLYPDTASIRDALGIDEYMEVDYESREIHSINPVENHEIVHLMLEDYGRLPLAFGEGTAYYLIGELDGKWIQPEAQRLLREDKIPPLLDFLSNINITRMDASTVIFSCASFVGFLLEYAPPEKFLELHRQMMLLGGEPGAFLEAFQNAYERTFAEAEEAWRLLLANADFSGAVPPGGSARADSVAADGGTR